MEQADIKLIVKLMFSLRLMINKKINRSALTTTSTIKTYMTHEMVVGQNGDEDPDDNIGGHRRPGSSHEGHKGCHNSLNIVEAEDLVMKESSQMEGQVKE